MSHTVTRVRHRLLLLRRLAGFVLLCFLATGVAQAASKVKVTEAGFTLSDDVYRLDASLDIQLPPKARRAIADGLTLRLDYEVEISRVRRFMIDDGVASLEQSYEINFHALSQRYLLRNLNTGEQEDFGTLDLALERLARVEQLPVFDAGLLEPDRPYEVRLRAVLDMSAVPDALQWMLFWADDWSAESEWYVWSLQL